MSVMQDYKDWKKARSAVQRMARHINCFEENLVQECDEQTWQDNIVREKSFNQSCLPNDFGAAVNALIHVHNYISQTNKLAQKYRASSCFYKFKKEENCCINFSFNREITDKRCDGCKKYLFLKLYQVIFKKLQDREQKCENAKQKLLSNFTFWRTK